MQNKKLTAPLLVGLLLTCYGAVMLTAWAFDLKWISGAVPGGHLLGPLNPALLVATGWCFLQEDSRSTDTGWHRAAFRFSVCALVALPVGYLVEALAGASLGIDIAPRGGVPTSENPYPGRISPNAAVAFLATGFAFWLWPQQLQAGWRRWAYLAATTLIGVIGLAGMAGYALGLEFLYKLAKANKILPVTAFALSVVAAGLWALLERRDSSDRASLSATEGRIHRRTVAVITLVALASGVAGFGVMRSTFERSISRELQLTALTTSTALGHAIEVALWFPKTVAPRPSVKQSLNLLSSDSSDARARSTLQNIADAFLSAQLSGVEIMTNEGVIVARAGTRVASKALVSHALITDGQTAHLLWSNGYVLAAENEVLMDGRRIGKILTEQRLPLFDQLLEKVRTSSESSDAAICSTSGTKALCAPTRFRKERFEVPLLNALGEPTVPIVRGLRGEQGVQYAKDLRGIDVVSAFTPIGTFGLGFAVKQDVNTLFLPLQSRVGLLLAALLAIVALGIYTQRSQVRPIVRRVVQSEQQVKKILEEQSELVSLALESGELQYVNPAYAKHFGLTPGKMVGANFYDHVAVDDRVRVRSVVAQVLHSGVPNKNENRVVDVEGNVRWVSWTNSLQISADGQKLLHSVGRDITARRQAQSELLKNQAMLERTGRVAGVGGWELNLQSNELVWTEQTRRIHEVSESFVPTVEAAIEFYAPEAREAIRLAVECAIRDATSWDLELPLVTAKGNRIWVRAQGQPEYEDGVPVRLAGAFQDITERKHLEQQLADRERFVRQITDNLPVRIAYLDREARFRFVNSAHCRRFGLDREEIIGRTRDELARLPATPEVQTALAGVLAGQEQRTEFEDIDAGHAVRIESRMIPDVSEDGAVNGFYTIGVDITERSRSERALKELTVIFEHTTDFVVQTDWRGYVSYMNPAVRAVLGLGLDESIAGRTFREFNTPETNERFAREIDPAVRQKGVWIGDTTVLRAGGHIMDVNHMVIAHRGGDGRIERYSAIMRDIGEQRRAHQEQQRNAATLRSIAEAIPAMVAVVGADGVYRFANSAFERWIGSSRAEIVGCSLLEVLGRTEYERSKPWVDKVLSGETVNFEKEYPGRQALNNLAISYIPLWLEDGSVDGFIGVAQDITQHKREEVRLLQLTQRDVLTGLLNRAGFERFLEQRMCDAGEAQAIALLYIDLDHFKPVNDTYGHPIGDLLLQRFAQRLQAAVRPTDAVARLGGDEFAMALCGVSDRKIAQGIADKVIHAATSPFELGEHTIRVGASVGVAFGADSPENWRDMVARADTMLYSAKRAGRGKHAGVDVPASLRA